MANLKAPEWTVERIAGLSVDQLKNLRDNASRLEDASLLQLCEIELGKRSPTKKTVTRQTSQHLDRRGKSVTGFHFVCDREKGVAKNPDGTFWTGT